MAYSLSETDKTKIATEAAESFVDLYYTAINAARHTLKDFYLPSSSSGGQLPHIVYNGELLQDAKILQDRFEKQMPWCHYEAQSVNAHVMNPCIDPNGSKTKKEAERNLSLLVQISGYVRLVERKDGPVRAISDNFVLVPNKEEVGAKGTGIQDQGKKWLWSDICPALKDRPRSTPMVATEIKKLGHQSDNALGKIGGIESFTTPSTVFSTT